MALKRGEIVVVAARAAYLGKPRPAVVVQWDVFNPAHPSVTVCPITSECIDAPLFRVALPPGERTALAVPSQVMVDKIGSVPRAAIGRVIGRCEDTEMTAIADALRQWLDLG
jgi:mRNA interferase MazF